jgi:polyisoprenoid-binding protein YceI
MTTTMQPLVGTYVLDGIHSSVQFAVGHQQVSLFRASFGDVEGSVAEENGAIALEGRAVVESISIGEPAEFREHVVRSTDFFDADAYPLIAFRSSDVELREDGTATVTGELTIRGATGTISAHGTYHAPRQDPFGRCRAGLELQATIDRRSWDLSWQLPLPDGRDALGWDVGITAHLELVERDR